MTARPSAIAQYITRREIPDAPASKIVLAETAVCPLEVSNVASGEFANNNGSISLSAPAGSG